MSSEETDPSQPSTPSFTITSPYSSTTSSPAPPPPHNNPAPILLGTVRLEGYLATTLFDTGSSHNFVVEAFVEAIGLPTVTLDSTFMIATLLGVLTIPNRVGEGALTLLHEHDERDISMTVPLKVLANRDFDLVLDMKWMQQVGVMIDMEA